MASPDEPEAPRSEEMRMRDRNAEMAQRMRRGEIEEVPAPLPRSPFRIK